MSPFRLEQGEATNDVDKRIANLVRAYEADFENPDRLTVLWLLENWSHARKALQWFALQAQQDGDVSLERLARRGLDVVGE